MMIDSERESLDINIDELYRPFSDLKEEHCVKTVRIRSYSGPHFSAFGLNTERYSEYRYFLRSETYLKSHKYAMRR